MKTYAPSFTNSLAVARPMPLLPPVMSAIFPSSLPMIRNLLPIGQRIARTDDERLVSFQPIEYFNLFPEIPAERNASRLDDPVPQHKDLRSFRADAQSARRNEKPRRTASDFQRDFHVHSGDKKRLLIRYVNLRAQSSRLPIERACSPGDRSGDDATRLLAQSQLGGNAGAHR